MHAMAVSALWSLNHNLNMFHPVAVRGPCRTLTHGCNSLFACLPLRFEMVGGWCPNDVDMVYFLHTPLPALIFCPYLLYQPVLEYRDKLFTHSHQKPASKERIHHQGIVKVSLSLCQSPSLSEAPSSFSTLSNLLINQVIALRWKFLQTPCAM